MQEFVQGAGFLRRLQHVLERDEPGGQRGLHRAQHRSQSFGNVGQGHGAVFQTRGRGQGKELDQKEIDLVAIGR